MNPEISGPPPTLMEKLKTATAMPCRRIAREIRASNEAGDICWARLPYFDFRYDPAKSNL